jgi:hypothetical protein
MTNLKQRLDELPMRKVVAALALGALVLVPVLWTNDRQTWAIAVLLFALTMIVQATCIDLVGGSYRRLHQIWGNKDAAPKAQNEVE